MTNIKLSLNGKIIDAEAKKYTHDSYLLNISTLNEHLMITGLEDFELDKIVNAINNKDVKEHEEDS